MGMERAAVVLWRAELVSAPVSIESYAEREALSHLLRGSFARAFLLLPTGSKASTISVDGGGIAKDDEDSTSCSGSVEALRREEGRAAPTAGLGCLQRAAAALHGSSRRAMINGGWADGRMGGWAAGRTG